MRPHGRLEDGKGTGRELILFELRNLVLASRMLDMLDTIDSPEGSGGRGRAYPRQNIREFRARFGEEFPVESQPGHNWRRERYVMTYWILGSAIFAAG